MIKNRHWTVASLVVGALSITACQTTSTSNAELANDAITNAYVDCAVDQLGKTLEAGAVEIDGNTILAGCIAEEKAAAEYFKNLEAENVDELVAALRSYASNTIEALLVKLNEDAKAEKQG